MTELTRREREKAQHRRLMLEAAEVVFAQKGFHSATVHEVAERAEFSVGYMYNLFESKKDLFFLMILFLEALIILERRYLLIEI